MIHEYHSDAPEQITVYRKTNTEAGSSQADWGGKTAVIECRLLSFSKADFHAVRAAMFT